jgi:competence protein ComGC
MPPQKSGLAIASLVLGIAGIALCLGPLAGLPAVICGHLASARIKKSGGSLAGRGLATTGLITGYLSFLWIVVIGLMAALAIPHLVKARNAAQHAACIANLRTIESAKAAWVLEFHKKDTDEPSDADLFGPGQSITEKPVCPAGGTYSLNPVNARPSCSVADHVY